MPMLIAMQSVLLSRLHPISTMRVIGAAGRSACAAPTVGYCSPYCFLFALKELLTTASQVDGGLRIAPFTTVPLGRSPRSGGRGRSGREASDSTPETDCHELDAALGSLTKPMAPDR